MRALALVLLLAACSDPPREDRLVVFAASSLRDTFAEIGDEFERAHPDVELTFQLAGTQQLRAQIEQGAPADVLASADVQHVDELVRAGLVASPVVFAHNEPVIVVAPDVPVRALEDLPAATRIVIGAESVPIGRYTRRILERLPAELRARIEARIVSHELDVRAVLAKVRLGEADAGIVYRTDARSAGDEVRVVSIPPERNVVAEYPIAITTNAAHPALAREFVELVRSERGRRVLAEHGFAP
ncbi:molybdate ABC transporter substrate-binding protein [Sandaracinus amylolyticus]|uniref:Molybdenum ABC transporter, periplasmic molybdenum-binding protein ModA n=1 Tax=Sandaracinus amylolyticus TaxID=927083 RepID=A0A0F6YMC3_9BACT|nr:molybdate ABC transporter substrate-binding protein [Sandaracinus amylolyticus]AKF10851.1 Molybdenum ABC transporter, periplasmic molybdenum-binding protein ModA [Sandaracinus amylolyticus]